MITGTITKLDSKGSVFYEIVEFRNGVFPGFHNLDQTSEIMRRWIRLTKQCNPSLEQFLCSLLNVKSEDFVGENLSIFHPSKRVIISFRRSK